MAKKLDTTRDHSYIINGERGIAFSQDGAFFDSQGKFVEDRPEPVRVEEPEAPKSKREKTREKAAERAAEVLGDINPNPQREATKENAAAAQAESLADDA